MIPLKHKFGSVLSVLALVAVVPFAQAQVGSGWTSYSPSHTVQTVGSGSISGSTFSISSTSTTTEQRAEWRYSTVTSGQSQFQGTVKVNSLGGDRISLCQCFKTTGPCSLCAIKKPGTLYQVEGGATIGSLAIGSSARINTVINTSGAQQIYLNGSLKNTVNCGSGDYYHKLGAYRTASGQGPVSVTWSSIKFWKK